jgi:two-component system, NarL family, nitrate/nitrite response regulator NarL
MNQEMTPIRLLVVDDHTLFRRGLTALLSQDERFEVVGEAGDSGEALRRAERDSPDLILLDNHLPGVRGVDAIAGLKEVAPRAHVLMLTVSEDEDDLAAALQAGAEGYLLKTINSEDLCESIVKVMGGDSVVSPEMTRKLVTAFRSRAPVPPPVAATTTPDAVPAEAAPRDSLSTREREILGLIARGASNKVIARELDIAETTVKIHVQHILRKLGLSSRVQAAVYAIGRNSP